MSEEWLDPEEFPFTEEELLQAATLWLDAQDAHLFYEQIAESSRNSVEMREEHQLRTNFPPRSSFPGELSQLRICDFIQYDWLWPALSVLTPSTAARAQRWMTDHWRMKYLLGIARAKTDEAFVSGLYLPHDQAVERLRAEGEDVSWIRPETELRYPRVELPEATEEMRRIVHSRVEVSRQAWLALAAESKRRLDARISPTCSQPPTPPRP